MTSTKSERAAKITRSTRTASRVVALLTALLSATALAACGSDEPDEGDTSSPTGTTQATSTGSASLLVFGDPGELEAFRTLVDAYEAQAPGSTIELIEASDREDLITRLSTSIGGGAPPDLFLMNYRFYGQFAARDAIEPLDDRIAASTSIAVDDFYPAAMEAFQWEDQQLCMPQNVSSLVVYYNRALFEEYGVAEPADGWTWNDLLATAQAMTRDAAGNVVVGTESEGGPPQVEVYGLGVEPSMIRIAPFVWSNGGDVVDDPEAPTHFTFDTPEAREVLENFFDLRTAYGVVPTDEEFEAEDHETRFLNQRLAMFMDSRRFTTTLRASADFDWDVAALPMYDEPVSILHSDAYCITRDSDNKEQAWQFLQYAMSVEGQRVIAATGRTVPSNISVAESDAFLDGEAPSNAQVFLDAVENLRSVPTISNWPEIEDVSNGILENGLYRGDRLDDVVRALDEETREIFARAEHR